MFKSVDYSIDLEIPRLISEIRVKDVAKLLNIEVTTHQAFKVNSEGSIMAYCNTDYLKTNPKPNYSSWFVKILKINNKSLQDINQAERKTLFQFIIFISGEFLIEGRTI